MASTTDGGMPEAKMFAECGVSTQGDYSVITFCGVSYHPEIRTSLKEKMSSRAISPVLTFTKVPVTEAVSLWVERAHDIKPRPTATPRVCWAEGAPDILLSPQSGPRASNPCEGNTLVFGADCDSRGSRIYSEKSREPSCMSSGLH
jgi:hypothetical protein